MAFSCDRCGHWPPKPTPAAALMQAGGARRGARGRRCRRRPPRPSHRRSRRSGGRSPLRSAASPAPERRRRRPARRQPITLSNPFDVLDGLEVGGARRAPEEERLPPPAARRRAADDAGGEGAADARGGEGAADAATATRRRAGVEPRLRRAPDPRRDAPLRGRRARPSVRAATLGRRRGFVVSSRATARRSRASWSSRPTVSPRARLRDDHRGAPHAVPIHRHPRTREIDYARHTRLLLGLHRGGNSPHRWAFPWRTSSARRRAGGGRCPSSAQTTHRCASIVAAKPRARIPRPDGARRAAAICCTLSSARRQGRPRVLRRCVSTPTRRSTVSND